MSASLGVAIPLVLEGLFRQPLLVCLIVFVVGVAVVYILFKLGTSVRIINQRTARLILLCAAVIALLAVAVWPVFCSLLLFTRHEYLLGAIPLLYAFPYCFGVTLVIGPILTLVKTAREHGADAAYAQFHAWADDWHEKIRSDAGFDELVRKHRAGLFWKRVSKLLGLLQTLVLAPRVAYMLMVVFRFGKRIPFLIDFETPFFVLSTLLAYLVASAHHPVVALILSSDLLLVKLHEVTSRFDTRSGVLKTLLQDKYPPRISDIVLAAAVMAGSFGCIHYCVSILNPLAYSRPLTAIDGLYFSVTTFATVGYGDIYPASDVSKLVSIAEIASGCTVLLFGVNLAMMVWYQKFIDGQADPTASAPVMGHRQEDESKPLLAKDGLTTPAPPES